MQNGVTNTGKHPSALGGQDCPWGAAQHCDTLARDQTLPVVDFGGNLGRGARDKGDERMKHSLSGRKGDGENPGKIKGQRVRWGGEDPWAETRQRAWRGASMAGESKSWGGGGSGHTGA